MANLPVYPSTTDGPDFVNLNTPGNGPSIVNGKKGNDTLISSQVGGSDLNGDEDRDSLTGLGPNDSLKGGPGDDIIRVLQGPGYVLGDAGADLINADATATVQGGEGNDSIQALSSKNVLYGSQGEDLMIGGAVGGQGLGDTLYGGKGNDKIGFIVGGGSVNIPGVAPLASAVQSFASGNKGYNIARGDLGDDQVYGAGESDSLYGGKGNDVVQGAGSYSQLWGDRGDDTLQFSTNTIASPFVAGESLTVAYERVTLEGGSGNDVIISPIGPFGGSNNFIAGDKLPGEALASDEVAGNDTITTYGNQDTVLGGGGNDIITSATASGLNTFNIPLTTPGYFGKNVLDGGDGNDTITAASFSDTMFGAAGNDSLSGLFSYASGGDGDDTVNGLGLSGTTPTTLDGGVGNDYLIGNTTSGAVNSFDAGAGDDTIVYGSGSDKIIGIFDGSDVIDARNISSTGTSPVVIFDAIGNNLIFGSGSQDSLVGGSGGDTLDGGTGTVDDTLLGGDGNDLLSSQDGNDRIEGNNGDDTLIGGVGSDQMLGGAGADKFVYYGTQDGASSTLGSQDYIGDFDPSVDRLLINRGGFGIGGGEALTVNVDSNPSSITVSGAAVVIYARQTGNIYFDPDGATAGGAEPTLLATLTNTPTNLPSASVLFF
jgi:Ca2+-binding RTX toxin-like protein